MHPKLRKGSQVEDSNQNSLSVSQSLSIDLSMFGLRLLMNNCLEMQTTNLLCTLPVSHYMNLCQAKQLQRSPQYRKSCTHCSFKYEVNIVPIYLLCLGKTFPFLLCWGYKDSNCLLHGTKHVQRFHCVCGYPSASIKQKAIESQQTLFQEKNPKKVKNQREKHGQAFLPAFLIPSKVGSVICPETFP